ncbi:MAG: hypothetical protein DHS20C13_19810 [Thermodesulfobacteriota bacterium]|nr:MAG: hypothetical protein DHS20C13_19810 [Thermodesulfobacteriota bacterium]
MKPLNHTKILALLIMIIVIVSCAQKETAEPPVVQDVPITENATDNTVDVEPLVTEDSENKTVIEQITAKPEDKETAVTYPKIDKIKRYKTINKEESWFLVGGVTGERVYSVFVDPETIETENGLTTSWSKLEFEKTQRDEDGLSYQSVQINSAVDCDEQTYSYTDSKFYDGLGRLVDRQSTPYEALPIIDGTVSSKVADFVCGYQLNQPK